MLVAEKIALSFADISLVKDKIVCVDYLNEEALNVERGILVLSAIQKLTNYEPCVIIHNMGDKYIFSTDALRFMGSQLDAQNHKYMARATVTTNPAARIAANNFIKFYKPLIPTKLFTDVNTALTWAEEIIASKK